MLCTKAVRICTTSHTAQDHPFAICHCAGYDPVDFLVCVFLQIIRREIDTDFLCSVLNAENHVDRADYACRCFTVTFL